MKTWLPVAFGIAFAFVTGAAQADDASVAADLLKSLCANCHGKDGRTDNPTFPQLAGQQEEYMEAQIKAFRKRTRGDPHAQAYMWGAASSPALTEGVIEAISGYYSKQKPAPSTPSEDKALAEKGKALYLYGAADKQIPKCAGCHGPKAEGDDVIPRLAGQHKEYLKKQIEAFQVTSRENPLMHQNAEHLTAEDIDAVITYLGSQ
ncbi:MAG: c-type cytochrome [Alphaproteobacteria bacterium]